MQMPKHSLVKLSILILAIGAIMFVIGVHTFTFRGTISELYKQIGMFSFLAWLPTLLLGVIILIVSIGVKGKKQKQS